jgi:alanine racemase
MGLNSTPEVIVPSSWVEISESALRANFAALSSLCGDETQIAPVVKANAYGHGLELCARILAQSGADMLCVNELAEAETLSAMGLTTPIYVLGPINVQDAPVIAELGCHIVVSDPNTLNALAEAGQAYGRPVPVHVKLETGTNRQGADEATARRLVSESRRLSGVRLAGVSTHLADVEDETEHTYAKVQLDRFERVFPSPLDGAVRHCSSSAAHLLFERARYEMIRPGIAVYGLWPSEPTRISAQIVHGASLVLKPTLCWKTRIAQFKTVKLGDYVGYGRTHRAGGDGRIALLPVGYYDGYDRHLSNEGAVLIGGRRAAIVGRICMNMTMVNVSDIPDAGVGDEVVLLGQQDDEEMAAEELAAKIGTINYEVTTRIHERLPRIEVV